MDWIGDKLSMLIGQGKRALGTEVDIMSDAKEDEVDDGSSGWEENNDQPQTLPRSGSVKHLKRPPSILPPSFNIPIPHASTSSPKRSIYDSSAPTNSNFSSSSVAPSSAPGSSASYTATSATTSATPRRAHSRGISDESGRNGYMFTSPSFVEGPSSWESPEITESMEKARSGYFQRRIGGC